MSVLVLATADDEHATAVMDEIAGLGEHAELVDLSAFPEHARLAMRYDCCGGRRFTYGLDGRSLDLRQFSSVWYRRPQPPRLAPQITRESHRHFALNEAHEALTGLWYALDAFWVNSPASEQLAHRKAYQLKVAHDVGLRIPVTTITNDVDEARRFVDSRGYRDVVYKAFSATEEVWRETRLLRQEELDLLDNVRYTPVIFQEYIEAVYDLRITVVAGEVFGAAIHSQETSYAVDFRMDIGNAEIEPVRLPKSVEKRLRDLMRALGLRYGAIDMRRTPKDDYVFLEINPAGQWLFVEARSGQPITAALAKLLVEGERAAA